MRRIFTILFIIVFSQLRAQTIWNSGTFTFTKSSPTQQDCITANVCLTRGTTGVIYNEVTENLGDGNQNFNWTPGGTEWAYGTIANWNTLTYMPLYTLNNHNPPSMVNQSMVVHLTQNNIYLQLTFSFWGGSGGNFTYTRTAGPLGVNLISFDTKNNGTETILSWTTANEKNNAGFYVQRSSDGENFYDLAFVEAPNQENSDGAYNYADNKPMAGINYYRLKQVDIDGSSTFSNILKVNVHSGRIRLYPNPAHDNVTINSAEFSNSTVRLVNGLGVTVKEVRLNNGIIDLSDLNPGLYSIIINNGSKTITDRILKQ